MVHRGRVLRFFVGCTGRWQCGSPRSSHACKGIMHSQRAASSRLHTPSNLQVSCQLDCEEVCMQQPQQVGLSMHSTASTPAVGACPAAAAATLTLATTTAATACGGLLPLPLRLRPCLLSLEVSSLLGLMHLAWWHMLQPWCSPGVREIQALRPLGLSYMATLAACTGHGPPTALSHVLALHPPAQAVHGPPLHPRPPPPPLHTAQ